MHFLDACGGGGRHREQVIGKRSQVAPALAAKRHGDKPHRPRLPERRNHIRAFARCRNRNHNVAGLAQRLDLTGKNLFKAEIIPGSGERGGVSGQCNRRDG